MSENTEKPVLVICPHPDDAEFGCAGTIAQWAAEGRPVYYLICTNGDKGSSDPDMTSEQLAATRRQEQLNAAAVLGVKHVDFLAYPDGGLEDTSEFRGKLVFYIRKYRPFTVATSDPYRRYMWHRDHRITGRVVMDAVFPYARDRLSYPEQIVAGLRTHKVKEVYFWAAEPPNHYVDISSMMDTKLNAVLCHKSQVADGNRDVQKWIKDRASMLGKAGGYALAEGFYRLEVPY
jgi:LmbE family N-acetylglucosaminyl deacetylase